MARGSEAAGFLAGVRAAREAVDGAADVAEAVARLEALEGQAAASVDAGGPVERVRAKLIEFIREHKLKVGFVLPDKPFRFDFTNRLEGDELPAVDYALRGLVEDGVLENRGAGKLHLTEEGFRQVYGAE